MAEPSLIALILVLNEAHKRFSLVDNADIVLAVGNTGCGKSTMLSSLLDGASSMQI